MFGLDKEPEVVVVSGTSTVKQIVNTLYSCVPINKDESNEKEILDKRAATVTQTLNTFFKFRWFKNSDNFIFIIQIL